MFLPLKIFTFFWSTAILLHIGPWLLFTDAFGFHELLQIVLLIACFSGILFPGFRSLVALSTVQLVLFVYELPEVPNHWLLTAFVNIAFLLSCLKTRAKGEKEVFDTFLPIAQGITVILYFFAFFHKLNLAFINPNISCASRFLGNIKDYLPIVPKDIWIDFVSIYGTLAVEALFVPFLLIPKTRTATVKIAQVFHFALALDYTKAFLNFSSPMFALLTLFLPLENAKEKDSFFLNFRRAFIGLYVASLAVFYFVPETDSRFLFMFRQNIWLIYALLVIVWTMLTFRDNEVLYARTRISVAGWVIVILCFVNGLSPYLGLKNRNSFQMYSNLQITSVSSNHLFIPRSLDMLGYFQDTVEIKSSNHEGMPHFISPGFIYPRIELLRILNKNPDFVVTFVEKSGVEKNEKDLEKDISNYSPLTYKLTWFGPVGIEAERECIW